MDSNDHILTAKIPWLMNDPRTINLKTASRYLYVSCNQKK